MTGPVRLSKETRDISMQEAIKDNEIRPGDSTGQARPTVLAGKDEPPVNPACGDCPEVPAGTELRNTVLHGDALCYVSRLPRGTHGYRRFCN